MALSWVILAVSGRSLEEAQKSGWFFQKIPSNEPILGLDLSDLSDYDILWVALYTSIAISI